MWFVPLQCTYLSLFVPFSLSIYSTLTLYVHVLTQIVVASCFYSYNLYNKFLPRDHPVVRDFHDPTKRSIRQSNGHIFLFCKIKGDATELGLPRHNIWYFNSYDLDVAFDKYFKNPREVRPPTGKKVAITS